MPKKLRRNPPFAWEQKNYAKYCNLQIELEFFSGSSTVLRTVTQKIISMLLNKQEFFQDFSIFSSFVRHKNAQNTAVPYVHDHFQIFAILSVSEVSCVFFNFFKVKSAVTAGPLSTNLRILRIFVRLLVVLTVGTAKALFYMHDQHVYQVQNNCSLGLFAS